MAEHLTTVLEGRNGTIVEIGFDKPFVMIGERLNPTNRKVLAAQLKEGDMTLVRKDTIRQIEAGAKVIDVNVGFAGADELKVMPQVIRAVMEETDLPLCIDSSKPESIEAGLRTFRELGGKKALINSTTGEAERMDKVMPLAKTYGAAIIGLAHDERGIDYNIQHRVEAAKKIMDHGWDKYGIPKEDFLIDCLTLAVGANTEAGLVTLEVQIRVWQELGLNTTAGASNVSFGMPDRLSINIAYLPLLMSRGLTSAITNPLEEEIVTTILASDLLMAKDENGTNWITSFQKKKKREAEASGV